jgi:hypothetical protein
MVQKTEIVDQLTECGTSVIEDDNDLITYSYLEFSDHGRIHNVQIFAAAKSKFEATLAKPGARFIFCEMAHVVSKKKTNCLVVFQSPGEKAYKMDLYGSIHPEYARQMSMGTLLMKVILVTGILIGLVSVPLLLLGVGFLGLIAAAAMIWFSSKTLKNLRRMRDTYQSVLVAFPSAVEL